LHLSTTVICGNSGAGIYAKKLAASQQAAHLDLDSLAWEATNPPTRRSVEASSKEIEWFIQANPNWVIEGCYADLLAVALAHAEEAIFVNPGIQQCVDNAKARPWETHKYPSKEAQDQNLTMLIDWITPYDQRSDEFSLKAHQQLFDNFQPSKTELTANA
jgi:adenylate kinase family enzyme